MDYFKEHDFNIINYETFSFVSIFEKNIYEIGTIVISFLTFVTQLANVKFYLRQI